MRLALRGIALLVMVAAVLWWAAAGGHRGWSKTSVKILTLDPITGIESPTYEDRFVPGVDTLALGAAAAVMVFGASFLVRRGAPRQA